ncbi:4Fe-4S single cluster domain-containing protein [Actinocrispum wychmicini]|uniref:Anaerobic ribonucleoside-triphosphate reductase activating protein n=1 Tax=Actinocrispum wychmicini TaxID=1213861 RepID=A0A4R2J626_9PSEU|nr:4Fe-4S single cluster domain-containing protein [Actinocrispum wychmicini]TCO52922.1 anaerobic ribonucleoside-triphosphate reductase activating protein [Actinocrispum wychmicini]
MTTLTVSRTHYPVTALGPGNRLGVWVQGCSLACKGCMSQDTWNPMDGTKVAVDDLVRLWREAVDAGADGLTVSGGEPLQQPAALREFLVAADDVRSTAGREIDILVYTGYEQSEMDDLRWRVVAPADVVVTGRFDIARPTSLIWRGSANQRMVLRTDLGERRYADYVDHAPERPPIQVRSDAGGIWLIGVPRRGGLTGLERGLRGRGLDIEDVSWRR